MVKFSVINKNCGVGGVIQLGVMDEGALIKRGSYLMDMCTEPMYSLMVK